ncbi:MAG: hypothetical protein ACTHKG_02400, partial [Nocardioides sp.]
IGSVLALAGSAAAATTTITPDPVGDMDHGADIVSVKVVNEKSVRVVLKAADLVPSYQSGAGVKIYFDTDPQDAGPEYAFLGGLFDGTDYGVVAVDGWKVPKYPTTVGKFYIMKLDYEKDVAKIRISRAALGRPDAIRVAVRTSGEQPDGDYVHDWLGARREFTPWITRG